MSWLAPNTIDAIESAAQDAILATFGDFDTIEAPIHVWKIAERYGIQLQIGRFQRPDVVGAYSKNPAKIILSPDDPYERQVFTVAHELGHFFLHQDKDREIFFRTQLNQIHTKLPPEETEANWFAASLIMPKRLIYSYWKLTHKVDELATIFAVSPAAVNFRLKGLGLS